MTLFKIKEEIEMRAEAFFNPKAAQLRVHMGYILKSSLSEEIIRNYPSGRTRGASYFLSEDAKTQHSLSTVCRLAQEIVPVKKKAPKKIATDNKKQDDIAFKYFDEESETPKKSESANFKQGEKFYPTKDEPIIIPPRIKIEGEMHFHFHFHIER
jgi:hypothetical protein